MNFFFALVLGGLLAVLGSARGLAGPNDVAIIISNQTYMVNAPAVEFASRDGEAFAKAARDVLQVPRESIVQLHNLTGTGFRRWFGADGSGSAQLASLVRAPDTRFFVFYSGHGVPAEINGRSLRVLLPVDADPAQAGSEGYPIEHIRSALSKMLRERAPKGKAITFFDACFSGSSAAGTLVSNSSSVALSVSKLAEKPEQSVIEIAATSATEVAYWDVDRKHGVFTDALIDGLYGSAADRNGNISAAGLMHFVRGRMESRLSSLYPGDKKRQTPVLFGDVDETLASLDMRVDRRPVRDERVAAYEHTMCSTLPRSRDEKRINEFLSSCRECRCRDALEGRLRDLTRSRVICETEAQAMSALLQQGPSARAELEAMAATARCESVRTEAQSHVARISSAVAAAAVPVPVAPVPAPVPAARRALPDTPPPPPSLDDMAYVKKLQSELKRVACATGPVDGKWGPETQVALKSIAQTAKVTVSADHRPLAETMAGLEALPATTCPPTCKVSETLTDGKCVANLVARQVQKPTPRPAVAPTPKAAEVPKSSARCLLCGSYGDPWCQKYCSP